MKCLISGKMQPGDVYKRQEVTMANDDPLGFLENSEENLFQTCLEFVDVRLMLEPEVAAMAATNADYADCQKLQMLQREVGQLVDQGKDHIAADIEYHLSLIHIC